MKQKTEKPSVLRDWLVPGLSIANALFMRRVLVAFLLAVATFAFSQEQSTEVDVDADKDGVSVTVKETEKSEDLETRKETTISVEDGKIGIEGEEETYTKTDNPTKILSNVTWSIGGSFLSTSGISLGTFNGGLGWRGVFSGKNFPGMEGGKVNGFLAKVYLGGGAAIGPGGVSGNIKPSGVLGWSWLNFKPKPDSTLMQKGTGFSLGVELNYSILLYGGGGGGSLGYGPYFAVDTYRYNPSTSKYKSASFYGLIWPYPFMISIGMSSTF